MVEKAMGTISDGSHQETQAARERLEVQIRFLPHLPLVRLSGSITHADIETVRDALEVVLGPVDRGRLVVLDLRRVIRCEGLAAAGLARLLAELAAEGNDVRLQGAPALTEEIAQRTTTWSAPRAGQGISRATG
jgi:hypothetical protein